MTGINELLTRMFIFILIIATVATESNRNIERKKKLNQDTTKVETPQNNQ